MKKFNKKGFTIVELVIVIAVIAILAGVLIPTFSTLVKDAQDSKAMQEAKNVYTTYLTDFNYKEGTPATEAIVKVDGKYFAVKDSALQTEPHNTLEAAQGVAGQDAEVFCDEHAWGTADAQTNISTCTDCEETHEHNTNGNGGKCSTCGK